MGSWVGGRMDACMHGAVPNKANSIQENLILGVLIYFLVVLVA